MKRRSFLAAAAGLAALGLPGCGSGSSSDNGGGFSGAGGPAGIGGQTVSGRIAPELVFSGAEIGSAYGPSTVTGNTFTTSISSNTVGLLALGDSSGGVRGFTLTFPGESPVFSAENSALAIIFMEPGFLRLDPTEARSLIASIRASSLFAPFVQILLANAGTRRLDLLSGDSTYVTAREALSQSLGNPFKAAAPTGRSEGRTGTIFNASPRFLRIVRDGQMHPQFLPPYGKVTDLIGASTYTFHGLGSADSLPIDTSLIEQTYLPTLVFSVFIPWLELAVGQKIPAELGLEIVSRLRAPTFNPRTALVSTTALATTMAQDSIMTIGDVAESINNSFTALTNLITKGSYLAGLAFSIGAIMKFKQHKDNPTQIPIGTPVALAFIAAALLFLPSILSIAGQTMFGDQGSQPQDGPYGP